jgi:hypothetical protein
MPRRESIVILDGARRTPRADIRENNRAPATCRPHRGPDLRRGRRGGGGGRGADPRRGAARARGAPSWWWGGGAESMQCPFSLYGQRGEKVGEGVQKYGPLDVKGLPPGTHLQESLLMSIYDPGA